MVQNEPKKKKSVSLFFLSFLFSSLRRADFFFATGSFWKAVEGSAVKICSADKESSKPAGCRLVGWWLGDMLYVQIGSWKALRGDQRRKTVTRERWNIRTYIAITEKIWEENIYYTWLLNFITFHSATFVFLIFLESDKLFATERRIKIFHRRW